MAIVTPALLQGLKTGFRADFQKGLEMAESQHSKVATTIPSTTASNTYGFLGQFPALREWVGDRQLKDMAAHGYQIQNKLWESTVGVKRTDIEDDNLGVYSPLVQEMGRAAAIHPDELVFGLLGQGHATLCYDGQNYFDTDHPVYPNVDGTGSPSNVANVEAGSEPAWYLLDTSRAIKPLIYQERTKPELQALTDTKDESVFTKDLYRYGVRSRSNVGFGFWQMAYKSQAALDAANFGKAYDAMSALKADGGRPLALKPTLLVVPSGLRAAAQKLIETQIINSGESNPNYKLVAVLVCPWI